MAMLFDGDQDAVMSEINVTPLVDVMLVLLTVFIVTAPLLMNSVAVKLPKATASVNVSQPKTAHVSITDQGVVFLNDKATPISGLEATLKQENMGGDLALDILADEKVSYGVVAQVMAAIQRSGITKFSFVMMPDSSKPAS